MLDVSLYVALVFLFLTVPYATSDGSGPVWAGDRLLLTMDPPLATLDGYWKAEVSLDPPSLPLEVELLNEKGFDDEVRAKAGARDSRLSDYVPIEPEIFARVTHAIRVQTGPVEGRIVLDIAHPSRKFELIELMPDTSFSPGTWQASLPITIRPGRPALGDKMHKLLVGVADRRGTATLCLFALFVAAGWLWYSQARHLDTPALRRAYGSHLPNAAEWTLLLVLAGLAYWCYLEAHSGTGTSIFALAMWGFVRVLRGGFLGLDERARSAWDRS